MVKSRKKWLKEKREAKAFSLVLTFSFLILAGILVFSNIKIRRETEELTKKKKELTRRLERLEQQKKRLEKGLSQSEKSMYWEQKIRNQGYKKPGESVVVVKRGEREEKNLFTEKSQPKKRLEGLWQHLLAQVKFLF